MPLVSIFMFVRNGAASVRRAVESVKAQTYRNIEFIVQDACSTDGTLDIVKTYGPNLKLISEPDAGPSDGLWRAINRCSGEFIGSCLADEELLPDAVERAVAELHANPDAGAITGDAILTDLAGTETGFWRSGPFNLVDYLFCDYTPYFVSSFFRRQSMIDAGIKSSDPWNKNCIEFELWCRLAAVHRVLYVPLTFAKYASHAGQSSSNPKDVLVHFTGRMKRITELCETSPLVAGDPRLLTLAVWGHARAFINHALGQGRDETARELFRVTKETLAGRPSIDVDGVPYDETYETRQATIRAAHEGPKTRWQALRRAFARVPDDPTERPAIELPPPPSPLLKSRLYARLAMGYETQDRLREAADTWQSAGRLLDLVDESLFPPLLPVGYTAKATSTAS